MKATSIKLKYTEYRNFYHYLCEGDARTKLYKRIEKAFKELIAKNGNDLGHLETSAFCDRVDFETYESK